MEKRREVILCKYGEIALKGLNKSNFEKVLLRNLQRRLDKIGRFDIHYSQSTVYAVPLDEDINIDVALEAASHVFGFVALTKALEVEKNLEKIKEVAKEYLPQYLSNVKTFKVNAKRSDKKFHLTSPELSAEVGGAILEVMPELKVSLYTPELTVQVEVRDNFAYIHAGQIKGAGGIPVGTGGKGLLMLSGGIDSPVAGHMMAKRGVEIEALHFESFPYTSERAKEKVLTLAKEMSDYCGRMRVNVISLTKIQEEINRKCVEDYFTLILRRFMMRLSEKMARKTRCEAIITGESLGQVASQTMKAINATDSVTSLPVFRPCIGLDKEEIVQIARRIGTFETSILPYEDCCTVFTPRHPKTQPDLRKVIEQESKLDIEALEEEALATLVTYYTDDL